MKNIKELLLRLVAVKSVSESGGEIVMANKIFEILKDDEYFLNNPSLCGLWDGGDALGRPVVWALKKGRGQKTIILSGHYDIVDTACYGALQPYALKPYELMEELRKNPPKDEELIKDLESGNWLFGRGCADMKAGIALNLQTLFEYAPDEVNVLFTAVSDEENLSAGGRQSAGLYAELAKRFELEYTAAVITEPIEREEGAPHPIINGSAGKILPAVVAKGVSIHGSSMMRGFNSARFIAGVIEKTEYDVSFVSSDKGMSTEPPAVLTVRDLKEGYDVSTPEYSAAAFNMCFFMGTDPMEFVDKLIKNCERAADELFEKFESAFSEMREKGLINPALYKRHEFTVTTLERLESELSERPEFEEYREKARQDCIDRVRGGETIQWAGIRYIKDIMDFYGGVKPFAVAGMLPPYYPAVNNDYLNKGVSAVIDAAMQRLKDLHGIKTEVVSYSQAMMDLSYMSCHNPVSARRVMDNMAVPESLYSMNVELMAELDIPSFVIGPARKEIHRTGERVFMPDLEKDLPIILKEIIVAAGLIGKEV